MPTFVRTPPSSKKKPSSARPAIPTQVASSKQTWDAQVPEVAAGMERSAPIDDFSRVAVRSTELASCGDATVTVRDHGVRHPVAESLAAPDVRFRLPTFDKVKAAYTDKTLKIPEAVIKDRVTQLLGRMAAEGRLKSAAPVADIVKKIFPAPGKMDQAEFDKAVDVADRSKIYQATADAEAKVKPADKPKLKTAMLDAAALVKKVAGDAAGLTQVFGAKGAIAKARYGGTAKALEDVSKDLDKHVTTDYNLDDPEVGLGGWASFNSKTMHLLLSVAQVADDKETKATVIHEAAHFANASVDDHVYYANGGFFELDEATKVNNAAHYEELPRRDMGTSSFDKKTFTPGKTVGGVAMTKEEKIKAAAIDYARQAWDAGVDAHMFIRGVRRAYESGNLKPLTDHAALIQEISKLMNLTVHEQAVGKQIVTTLDVTLSESVSRAVSAISSNVESEVVPPIGAMTDAQVRDKMIAAATTKHGNLLKDAAKDKALIDWLVVHYRSLPSV